MKIKTINTFSLLLMLLLGAGCSKDEPESDLATPTVSTNPISEITANSAISGGSVYNDGGYMVNTRGVCWSINPQPTIYDNTSQNDKGKGNYRSILENLKDNTIYYVRAYAENQLGITYGNEISFKTLEKITADVKVTTVMWILNSAEYSANGFDGNANDKYRFEWKMVFSLSGMEYVAQFGYILNGEKFPFKMADDGQYQSIHIVNSSQSIYDIKFQAYAKLLDGTYLYGNEMQATLTVN